MKSQVTKYNILTAAKVGVEFEFYTEKSSVTVTKELGKLLNKLSQLINIVKNNIGFNVSVHSMNNKNRGVYAIAFYIFYKIIFE